MSGFTEKIDNHPMLFAELNGIRLEGEKFTAPQATTNEQSQNGMIPLAPETIALGLQQQRTALLSSKPVAKSNSDPAYAFDATYAGGKLWTEQPGIGSLVCYTSDRS
jgi:hypothetical protein